MSENKLKFVDVTLVVDTAIYAAGDVLSDTAAVANATFDRNVPVLLQSLVAVDEADQGVAMDVYFLRANQAFGTFNAAPTVTDAGARDIVGKVSIAAADWTDLGGVRVAVKTGLNLPIAALTDTQTIFIATIVGAAGTPTFGTASDLKLRLGIQTQG